VRTFFFKKSVIAALLFCTALGALVACLWSPCFAEDQTVQASENPADANMIRVTADRLVTDTQSQNAEFIGNVNAIRGNMTIFCDSLKIFYTKTSAQGVQGQPGEGSIQRIVADGKVKINFDNQTATTQRAEWSPQEQTIVLSGPGSKIVSGKNSITGSKITLHQGSNRIQVEGDNKRRVEAQFFSNEQGMPLKQ